MTVGSEQPLTELKPKQMGLPSLVRDSQPCGWEVSLPLPFPLAPFPLPFGVFTGVSAAGTLGRLSRRDLLVPGLSKAAAEELEEPDFGMGRTR